MINHTHLAIVRAALTYWDEEMSSVEQTIYSHYLHSRDRGVVLTPESIAIARSFFNGVDAKTGSLNLTTGAVTLDELSVVGGNAQLSDLAKVVVLVPSSSSGSTKISTQPP